MKLALSVLVLVMSVSTFAHADAKVNCGAFGQFARDEQSWSMSESMYRSNAKEMSSKKRRKTVLKGIKTGISFIEKADRLLEKDSSDTIEALKELRAELKAQKELGPAEIKQAESALNVISRELNTSVYRMKVLALRNGGKCVIAPYGYYEVW